MMINLHLKQESIIGISAFLAIMVSMTMIYAAWQWHNDWRLTHQPIPIAPPITQTDDATTMIAAIPNVHLFGQSFSKIGDVPITSLQLHVTGIVKINDEHGNAVSKAYISISDQGSKIYQVGDHLPYGVKVYAITPHTVILENDGHLEKLPLPREPLQFKPPTSKERP